MNTQVKIKSVKLETLTIGNKVLKILEDSGNALTVQGVFDHALYLLGSNDKLIKVIRNRDFMSPTSILVEDTEEVGFKPADIKEGTKVIYKGKTLLAQDRVFTINLENASRFEHAGNPDHASLLSIEGINLNLRILRDIIYTAPSREGLVPLLENVEKHGPLEVFVKEQKPTMSEKARPYIDQLMWGIFGGDTQAVTKNAEAIMGLGPGLTPSCDDFLAGLMMSLNTAGASIFRSEPETVQFFKKISSDIAGLVKDKTTVYSQSFLHEASIGEGPKNAIDLILSIVTMSPEQVAERSKRLISVGATSGADISIGIYYGIRFLGSRIELRELNEFE
jgi:Protein of unknown function (DUF2877)